MSFGMCVIYISDSSKGQFSDLLEKIKELELQIEGLKQSNKCWQQKCGVLSEKIYKQPPYTVTPPNTPYKPTYTDC